MRNPYSEELRKRNDERRKQKTLARAKRMFLFFSVVLLFIFIFKNLL
jgi:hypothetical protein